MAAEFVTLVEFDDPKQAGRFNATAVVFGRMDPKAEIMVTQGDKSRNENLPDFRVMVTSNGTTAEMGVLWKSKEGKSSYANGKVDSAVSALMGWPAKCNLLWQRAKDDYPWRLTVVIDDAPANGGATDGSSDFGNDDDPFAEE